MSLLRGQVLSCPREFSVFYLLRSLTMEFINSPIHQHLSPQTTRIKMEAGPCCYKVLHYKCPCTAGLCISQSVELDQMCICGHLLAHHGSYNGTFPLRYCWLGMLMYILAETGSSPPCWRPVPYTVVHKEISPWHETVQMLGDLLQKHCIMHIRRTPASGKSVLSYILFNHLIAQNKHVLRIKSWDPSQTAEAYLAEVCHSHGYKDVQSDDIQTSAFIFLIDEAQQTYCVLSLWYRLVKTLIGWDEGPQFCLFSVYGSPWNGAVKYPAGMTPPILGPEQHMSLMMLDHPGALVVSLFYQLAKYQRLLKSPTGNQVLSSLLVPIWRTTYTHSPMATQASLMSS